MARETNRPVRGRPTGGLARPHRPAFLAVLPNGTFSHFALQVLGNWPERVLTTQFIFWLVGVLLSASRGKTRILWR